MLMIREMKKSYIYYKEYILIFTKQEKKCMTKPVQKDGLFWMSSTVGIGLVNFHHFYRHFLKVRINLSSLPKQIQHELS